MTEREGCGPGVDVAVIDTHFHVFPSWSLDAVVAVASYRPSVASWSQYVHEVREPLNVAGSVLVTPSVYGLDNGVLEWWLEAHPEGRGVAVVAEDVEASRLRLLYDRGVRGLRVNLLFPGSGHGLGALGTLDERIASAGLVGRMHLQVLMEGNAIATHRESLARLRSPVVFDHLGHVRPDAPDPESSGLSALIAGLKDGRFWVKLSGPYRVSSTPYPHIDLDAVVGALVEANPDRLVVGTDWPHPAPPQRPPTGLEHRRLWDRWVPTRLRTAIYHENAAQLYEFGQP